MGRTGILSLCLWLTFFVPADTRAFDFGAVRDLIAERGIGSVDDLIAALPADLRRHYALVFASRSLQSATPANPRAILYGTDATFIVTFNGDAMQRGFGSVETMAFDPLTTTFEFREIQFSGAGAAISDPNPARCIACHGSPARPIWDSPPTWPGVYGERYGTGLSVLEAKGMHAFLVQQSQHPRYRHLIDAAAFAQRETYVNDARAAYNGVRTLSPNAQLSKLLTTLNTRAILSDLVRNPAFAAHRYVLLAASQNDCGPLPEFYPKSLRSSVASSLDNFARASAAKRRNQTALKASRLESGYGVHAPVTSGENMDGLRFVAEQHLGIRTELWTLALERDSADPTVLEGSVTVPQALVSWVAATDKGLAGLQPYRGFSTNDVYCTHLRRSSIAALDEWYSAHRLGGDPEDRTPSAMLVLRQPDKPSVTEAAMPRPELLDRCIACHTGDIGPALPFAEPAKLAQRLVTGDYPRGRLLDEILFRLAPTAGADTMPRGMSIDAAQRRELEEYFLSVAAGQLKLPQQ